MKSSIDAPMQAPEPNDAPARQRPLAPVRLLAGGGSALERRLLESAGVDQMPHASRQRLQRALTGGATAPHSGGLASGLGASRFVRYGSFAGLGSLALLGAWALRGPLPAAPREVAPPAALAPASASQLTASPATPQLVLAPRALAPLPNARDVPESAATPRAPRPDPSNARATITARTPAAKAAPAGGGLREELRLLESAQTALRAGRVNDAQRALDEHARRFTGGELALEAELLSIEASLVRGQRQQAQARARALLARPGAARYRQRLEALQRAGNDSGNDGKNDSGASSDGANPRTGNMKGRRSSP